MGEYTSERGEEEEGKCGRAGGGRRVALLGVEETDREWEWPREGVSPVEVSSGTVAGAGEATGAGGRRDDAGCVAMTVNKAL
jgi:hypothetical protein